MSLITQHQMESAKKLLFISPLALGDFLYLKTFLIGLKQQYPALEIDVCIDDIRNDQQAWRLSRSKIMQQWITSDPAFTRFYGCCGSKAEQQQQIDKAVEQNYDLVICHSRSKSAQFSAISRKMAPNAFIVSSVGDSKFAGLLDWWLFRHSNKLFQLDPAAMPAEHHITDRFYQVMNSIAGLTMAKSEFMPDLSVPAEIEPLTTHWISKHFSDPERQGKLLFLNHLSTNTKKDWQLEQLLALIEKIAEEDKRQRFVINVTPEHYDAVYQRAQQFVAETQLQVAVFTVNKNFFELPSLIAQADFVITVDTAILHFAFAAKRPLLALMRQKKPYWAPPESPTSHVMYAVEGKGHISDIPVERVFQQYQKMNQMVGS
ncbi:glycosyltransferase family 9 protein [Shewanella sp. Isolate11]|uniref:glycosyltransferase family 9 protein n=1 Tax=Shewanella sp. Isolate11 TaxID=2908530 RepID=UPI001EFE60AF|nr:glycosyltransferase family 9 protein [Shewanella sp. Isolate11]MCG9697976.1 lipopolysaccharide heptosyltransferase family protein [Shewanella sp. Isolate11]